MTMVVAVPAGQFGTEVKSPGQHAIDSLFSLRVAQ